MKNNENETIFDALIGEPLNRISHENLSLFAFIWTLYLARISIGGDKGNFYKIEFGNSYYTTEMKVTINRKPSEEEMNIFKESFGFDVEKAIKEFQDAGLIEVDE